MATLTAERTMLYCPKCQREYKEGSQRFCNNDGGRLLPVAVSEIKKERQSKGVFTNLLAKTSPSHEEDEKLSKSPRFVRAKENKPFEPSKPKQPVQKKVSISPQEVKSAKQKIKSKIKPEIKPEIKKPRIVSVSKTISTPKKEAQKTDSTPKKETKETKKTAKPLSRLIKPSQIKAKQTKPADDRKAPVSNENTIWHNLRSLLGQDIKGRYHVVEKLNQDSCSVDFLAQDKGQKGKNVILTVLIQKSSKDDFQSKILAEERVSLSQLNHPNITKVIDSGMFRNGSSFIVAEHLDGKSVKNYLQKSGDFNPMRAARIIRQTSLALNEVHQNGILHRNLQPQHLILTVSEMGNETVKVKDFCVSDGKITSDNFKYKSPEQIKGQLPTFASDSYSLAVIAYEMLTNRLPFKGTGEKELFESQKRGLTIEPSNLNPDLNPLVDNILAKALSFNPSDRYPKARDFGEAFFNALTSSSPWQNEKLEPEIRQVKIDLPEEKVNSKAEKEKLPLTTFPLGKVNEEIVEEETEDVSVKSSEIISADIHIDSTESEVDFEEVEEIENVDIKVEEDSVEKPETEARDTLWQNRSTEPTQEHGILWTLVSLLGLLVLVVGAIWVWQYFGTLEEKPIDVTQQQGGLPPKKDPTIQDVDAARKNASPKDNIDVPPPEREIIPPKNFKYFENSKQNLSKELAENFRGFSLRYPENWEKVDTPTNYFDVKLKDKDGFPKQQFIVTRYDSKGTFELDEKDFPNLVAKSNKDLQKALPSFKVVSQGEITVNNGWKAYEVKFKGKTEFENKEDNFEIWGRRIWMPAARPGINDGFVITMLATSLSDKIESLDDVGKTGELGDILYTFEPERNY